VSRAIVDFDGGDSRWVFKHMQDARRRLYLIARWPRSFVLLAVIWGIALILGIVVVLRPWRIKEVV
jgi:hypothetical protein